VPPEKMIGMPLRILAECVPIEENCPLCKRPVFAGLLGDLPDGEPNDRKWIAAIQLKLVTVDGQRKTKRVVDSNLLLSANGRNSSIASRPAPTHIFDERPQKREYSMLLPVDSTRKTTQNPSGFRAERLSKQTA
jgi:hypothetical protein